MKKRTIGLIIVLLSIIYLSTVVFSLDNNTNNIIIVVGENAAQSDYNTANFILNNLTNSYNVKIVKDNEFIDDNSSTIISIGGSCINSVSAEILNVFYPTCTSEFSIATKVGPNQFLFKTFPLSNNRVEVLIAGYEENDTKNAGDYLLSKITNIQPRMYYIGNNIKSNI